MPAHAGGASLPRVRFTLDGWGDVEVPDGARLADVRADLVRLTGDPALRDVVLGVDGVPLGPDHPAGAPPWRPGALVEVGGGRADEVGAALDAGHHVAVVAGPDAGRVAVPGRDGRVVVGRVPDGRPLAGTARSAGGPTARLALTDPGASATHAVLATGRRGWTVRDGGSANGTAVRMASGRVRRARRRVGRRLRPGERVLVGSGTELEVRTAAVPDPPDADAARAPATGGAPLPVGRWLVPALVGLVVAAVTGSPVFLLLALTAPLGALGGRVGDRWRARRGAPDTRAPARAPLPDPATLRLRAVGPRDAADASPGPEDQDPAWWLAVVRGLALVGAPRDVAATARTVVGATLVERPGTAVVVHAGTPTTGPTGPTTPAGPCGPWAALRHLPDVTSPTATLAVLDLAATHGGAPDRPAADGVVVLVPEGRAVPPWCGEVVRCPSEGWPGAGAWWLDDVVRRVAARPVPPGAPPDRVALADLLPRTVAEVTCRWERAGDRLPVVLGRGAGGRPVEVDLLRDGPHALVAGTTGAGKSELLQSLVLALALTHPPEALALVLVDHKGGAGLGACRPLPHVVGALTDLDPAATDRALAGVRAELRRRERLLADAGVPDLDALRRVRPDRCPPRLVVVVDELRALVEDQPDAALRLARVAAQGRSLGLHLVLATQRPAGAVSAHLRANLPLRVCLRVADAADSTDVVDVPDAARLDPRLPGRALVRRGGAGPVEQVQTAWAALPPTAATAAARPGRTPPEAPDHAPALVALAVEAARGRALPEAPWLPPLPDRVRVDELEGARDAPDDGAPRPFALADLPDERRQVPVRPPAGPRAVVVVGGPRSGRTTALRALAAATRRGTHVHVVATGGAQDWAVVPPAHLGTVVGPDDPRRVRRLLAHLAGRSPDARRTLLVLDDVAAVVRALGRLGPDAPDLVERVVRDGPARGVGVVVAGGPRDVVRLVGHAHARLALGGLEPHDAALLGERAGPRVPGRGTWTDHDGELEGPVEVQVALPPPSCHDATAARGPDDPVRLRPVPHHVPLERVTSVRPGPGTLALPVGLGGDDAGVVRVDAGAGVLVVGPPGSGRSTALAVLAAGARAAGHAVTGPPDADGDHPPDASRLVVVDDVDLALRADPGLERRLATLLAHGVPVLAAARTDAVVGAFRGVLAELRARGELVVLDPGAPGSAQAAGVDLTDAVDPTRAVPGWAAVVRRGRVTPLQVADARPAPCAPRRAG